MVRDIRIILSFAVNRVPEHYEVGDRNLGNWLCQSRRRLLVIS